LLADHATVVVSGTKLAQELGSSRSEVWRLMQQLRALGVEITGHPATGYQLRRIPDLLLPDALAPLLAGTIFWSRIHHYFRVGSTNAEAMAAGAANEPEGSLFLAEEQTAGRGRGQRAWHSQRSAGIYLSVLLRPPVAPADALALSLAAGLAARQGVLEVAGIAPDLRWPNDLLLPEGQEKEKEKEKENEAKKFCGILTELNAEATRVRYAVVGIGMNVNHADLPAELRAEATSLRRATGREWSRVELAAAILRALDGEYRALLADPAAARAAVIRRFEEHSSMARACSVRVDEDEGYEGATAGLDDRGFLRVQTPRGLRTVLSGSVRKFSG
jgi:BirA family biotin operon repressor/biotin-[acetyl-CoA-carboxylase] ligase